MSEPTIPYNGRCHIAVGSNIRPEDNIPRALDRLNRHVPIKAVSMFYRTAPINRPEQPDYLNGVVAAEYAGALHDLKFDLLRRIEAAAGRVRGADPWAARTLDLDIALCGGMVVNAPGLVVPDPDIRTRPFLAAALLELEPDLVMPDSLTPLKQEVAPDALAGLTPDPVFSQSLKERYCS